MQQSLPLPQLFFLGIAGLKPDKKIQAILNKESAIAKFRKLKLDELNQDKDKESTLVTEAKAFALRIDPPPPPKPPEPKKKPVAEKPNIPTPRQPARLPNPPKKVKTSKFSLVATCRYENVPDKSLALLNIVSEGNKWVRQGETVGHLTVQEVKDGSIVLYQDEEFNTEIFVPEKRPTGKSLIRDEKIASAVHKQANFGNIQNHYTRKWRNCKAVQFITKNQTGWSRYKKDSTGPETGKIAGRDQKVHSRQYFAD